MHPKLKHARLWFLLTGTALLVPGGSVAQEPTTSPGACALSDSSTTRGKLAGIVRHGLSGLVVSGAWTVLQWAVEEEEEEGARATGQARTMTDSGGRFWFCEVPAGARVALGVEAPAGHFASAVLVMPDGFARRDLTIRTGDASPGDVAVRILDVQTEEPVGGAVLWLSDVERGTITDEDGRARLSNLPPGTHEYEVQRIGYGVQTGEVEVRSGYLHDLEIRLAPEPLALEPLTVTVEFRPEWLVRTGFYRRQSNGLGYYLSPEDIEKRNPIRFSHLVEMDTGVRLVRVCNPRCGVVLRTAAYRNCSPEIYMDGKKLRLPWTLDLDAVPVWDVAAIEMYTGISETPPEFYGLCGSLVIWTKRQGR